MGQYSAFFFSHYFPFYTDANPLLALEMHKRHLFCPEQEMARSPQAECFPRGLMEQASRSKATWNAVPRRVWPHRYSGTTPHPPPPVGRKATHHDIDHLLQEHFIFCQTII